MPSDERASVWGRSLRRGVAQITTATLVLGICAGAPLLTRQSPKPTGNEPAPVMTRDGEKGQRQPVVLAELPSAPTSLHRPGKGLPAWGTDAAQLLYLGKERELRLLRLDAPGRPEIVAYPPTSDGIPGPAGDSVIYVGARASPDEPAAAMTLFSRGGAAGPVDLLPGEAAIHGTSTVKHIHRWITSILAFEEHLGTGASQLFLLDIDSKRLIDTPRLAATFFLWSRDGNRLAGQWAGGPPHFWLWDRTTGQVIATGPLPGASGIPVCCTMGSVSPPSGRRTGSTWPSCRTSGSRGCW